MTQLDRVPKLAMSLPKAELHVHLEGTLEPELLLTLARRNGVDVPWNSVAELQAAYDFTSLEPFLAVYFKGCQVLRQRQDFVDLTVAYLRKAASQGVRRAEMYFGPQTFLDAGIEIGVQLGGILDGIAYAREESGIDGALILSAHRHRSEADAFELLELAETHLGSIAGIGLGSAERDNPPSKFARFFDHCHDRRLPITIHAGEEGPADYIWQALDVGHAARIDHGVAAISDPVLVQRLADEQIPLTMCPLSNLRLGVVPHLSAHPLRTLLEAGVAVTVNSDDPPYFGGYIGENFVAIGAALDLTDEQVVTLARNSFRAAFAEPSDRARWISDLDGYLAMD